MIMRGEKEEKITIRNRMRKMAKKKKEENNDSETIKV